MRILIAEDERISRRTLQRTLEKWDHEVVAAEDGALAWEAFQRGEFDIVVTDWDMPEMDGRDLVRRIRASDRSRYAYIIMLTARAETLDLVSGMEAGADDYLPKPFDRDELRVRLTAGERIVNLERRLAEKNTKLHAANEQLHRDLEAAARIQQELLPRALPTMSRLRFAWRYLPCDELGGDLLNVVPLGESEAAVYLADVSGHGVAAALVSVSVHRSLSVRHDESSLIVESKGLTAPGRVAQRLNALYPMESNGGRFFTLAYASIDEESLTMRTCAAGHPGPVIARRDESIRSLEPNGMPIGIEPEGDYPTVTTQLAPGDRVIFYSDGLMEAMTADHQIFGQEGIEATVARMLDHTLDETLDALIEAAINWQGSDQFTDDLSIVAFEVVDGSS